MSTLIMADCWKLQQMSPSQKSVLISLADQANDDGVCWPSVGTIAKRTCLSERAVQDAIAWLQSTGALFRTYQEGTSTRYTVTPGSFDPSKAPSKRERAGGANGAPPQMAHPTPADGAPQGCKSRTPPPQMAHQGGADGAPKSSMNLQRTVKGTINEGTSVAKAPVAPMLVSAPNGTVYEIPGELRYPGENTKSHKTWLAYAIAYEGRYHCWPVWNATVGGQLTKFIERVGADRAPRVAVHYIRRVNEEFIVKQMHPVKLLLSDAEKWVVQSETGASMTGTRAKQIDQTQSNFDAADEAMAILRAKRAAQEA